MPPHADGAGLGIQAPRNLFCRKPFHVAHLEKSLVILPELRQGAANGGATLLADQVGQGISRNARFLPSGLSEPLIGPEFAPVGSKSLLADVPGRLIEEGRQSREVLYTPSPERLERSTQCLLSHVLGEVPVAETPRREEPKAIVETQGELGGHRVRIGAAQGWRRLGRRRRSSVTVSRHRRHPVHEKREAVEQLASGVNDGRGHGWRCRTGFGGDVESSG